MPEETRRDWEVVQQNANDVTDRLRVVSGWLYRTSSIRAQSVAVALTFVPARVDEDDESADDE